MLSKTVLSRTVFLAAVPMLFAAAFSAAAQTRAEKAAEAAAAARVSEQLFHQCLNVAAGKAVARQDSPERAVSRMFSDCTRQLQQLKPLLREDWRARGEPPQMRYYLAGLRLEAEAAYSERLARWNECMTGSNGDGEIRCPVFETRFQFEGCLQAALDGAAQQLLDADAGIPRAFEACDWQWDQYYAAFLVWAREQEDGSDLIETHEAYEEGYHIRAAEDYPRMLAHYQHKAGKETEMRAYYEKCMAKPGWDGDCAEKAARKVAD